MARQLSGGLVRRGGEEREGARRGGWPGEKSILLPEVLERQSCQWQRKRGGSFPQSTADLTAGGEKRTTGGKRKAQATSSFQSDASGSLERKEKKDDKGENRNQV